MFAHGSTRLQLTVNETDDNAWHKTLSTFADIHLEQTAIYGASHARERQRRLLIQHDDRVVAGIQLGCMSLPMGGRELVFARFGPFWRRSTDTDPCTYREVLRLLQQDTARRKSYLVVRPRAHPEHYSREAATLVKLGFTESASTKLDRYLVDASLDEEAQLKSFDQGWRAKLRKALKHDIQIEAADDAEGRVAFTQLYQQMVERKHLNFDGVERADLLAPLMQLPGTMKLRLVLAKRNGLPIGGAAYAILGDVAYYVFGASSDQALKYNAGYRLQWWILARLRQTGVRWYELGGPGDPGIRQFKKGLIGKRGIMLPIREFHYTRDHLSRAMIAALFLARDARNAIKFWQRRKR